MVALPREPVIISTKHPVKEAPTIGRDHGFQNLFSSSRESIKNHENVPRATRDIVCGIVWIHDRKSIRPVGIVISHISLPKVSMIICHGGSQRFAYLFGISGRIHDNGCSGDVELIAVKV